MIKQWLSVEISKKMNRYFYVMFEIDRIRRNRMFRQKIFSHLPLLKKIDNFILSKDKNNGKERVVETGKHPTFLAGIPHATTGIGHAFAEWNTGRIIAHSCNIDFVHMPLPEKWEDFFEFGNCYKSLADIVKIPNLKIVRLPDFDQDYNRLLDAVSNKINTFTLQQPTLFLLADGQNLYQHNIHLDTLKNCYFKNHSDNIQAPHTNITNTNTSPISVAVHIRRGDIVTMKDSNQGNWQDRYIEISWFEELLEIISKALSDKDLVFNIYSQGNESDFKSLLKFPNSRLFINYDQYNTMEEMIQHDILILSPSGFSYMAGLISNGLKIAKFPWWHEIPDSEDWCRSGASPTEDCFDLTAKIRDFFNKNCRL